MPDFRMFSFMRRGSAGRYNSTASFRFCGLGPKQPLLLHREPSNRHDSNAVRCTDVHGQHVGYVAREHAPLISAKLAEGLLLLCRTNGPCHCFAREILIWSEGLAQEKNEQKQDRKPALKKQRRKVSAWGGNDDYWTKGPHRM